MKPCHGLLACVHLCVELELGRAGGRCLQVLLNACDAPTAGQLQKQYGGVVLAACWWHLIRARWQNTRGHLRRLGVP